MIRMKTVYTFTTAILGLAVTISLIVVPWQLDKGVDRDKEIAKAIAAVGQSVAAVDKRVEGLAVAQESVALRLSDHMRDSRLLTVPKGLGH